MSLLQFYSSDPPCGDSAIFGQEDEPPAKRQRAAGEASSSSSQPPPVHRTGARPAGAEAMAAEAATGGNECALGLLRTKPGRGERTSCMSCSDKLAKWAVLRTARLDAILADAAPDLL